jgi:virulence-associated protein VagC
MTRAKLFWSGRSQAVRLPEAFRFEGDEVTVRREGRRVILEPLPKPGWPPGYWESWKAVPDDFEAPPPIPSLPRRG